MSWAGDYLPRPSDCVRHSAAFFDGFVGVYSSGETSIRYRGLTIRVDDIAVPLLATHDGSDVLPEGYVTVALTTGRQIECLCTWGLDYQPIEMGIPDPEPAYTAAANAWVEDAWTRIAAWAADERRRG